MLVTGAQVGVSIHAPAWGATRTRKPSSSGGGFQFTLPHGERPSRRLRGDGQAMGFNSRSRMGSDRLRRRPRRADAGFNSRSRMGSDPAPRSRTSSSRPFQFTLPHGERHPRSEDNFCPCRFQFTLPHGERQAEDEDETEGKGFNSRSRMGSDLATLETPALIDWFQFTLPHGERHHTFLQVLSPNLVSIHAPAWGATPCNCLVASVAACFNSRSRMGSDRRRRKKVKARRVSIHAPAWGATR